MRINFNGDWKFLLIVGGIVLVFLLALGALFSLVTGFLIFILKGLGFILGTVFRLAFSSIGGFFALAALGYLGYLGYKKLKARRETEVEAIDYTNEDFER